MADLLTAAAQALNAPEAIVKRSAEARAKASGTSVDDVLAAWSGGGTVTAAPPPPAPEPVVEPTADAPEAPAAPAPSAEVEAEGPEPEPEPLPEPEPEVEPAPLRSRVRVAGRIGALAGSALGLIAALVASPWLLPGASVIGEEGSFQPAVEVSPGMFILGAVLLSVLFGLIVASLARTVPGWIDPGMALGGSARVTALAGIGSGVVLGALGGGLVTSAFSTPIEGSEGRVVLPLLTALLLALIGGAVLGWVTAVFVQLIGIPAPLLRAAPQEVVQVRSRLGTAISVPLAGILALLVLVLPFAIVLIESNHLASGGASLLAILTAVSILTISGLAASRPGMKITRGEFLLALTGIGVVVTIIVAVFLARSSPH
ncbi:MAG TPA: hypothetical protein VJR05_14270, partial [Acidimicrobiia bacterium]|nr:hypothetical protein [Acidimicrobiia bacterium]